MSSLIIEKFKVQKVEPHFNAHSLDVITVTNWQVVTQKNKYKVGDEVIYIPVDTILSEELNNLLFPPDSKIKLGDNRRVKTIKIRQQISQGMAVDPEVYKLKYIQENCTKFEPPAHSIPNLMRFQPKKPKPEIRAFVKYTDIENGKYYDRCLQDGEEVAITTKLHGTSARYAWHKTEANIWYLKILNFLGLLKEDTFCYGSRHAQYQFRLNKKCYYDENVYMKILKQYELDVRIPKGYGVYGEIVGDGIQKGYKYGCESGKHKLYVYDVRDTTNNKWLNHDEMVQFCEKIGLETVPIVFKGHWNQDLVQNYIDYNPISPPEINEGVVVKPTKGRTGPMGRFVLKFINERYYLRQSEIDGTDFQ